MVLRVQRSKTVISGTVEDLSTSAQLQPIAFRIPDAAAASGLSRTTLYEEMDDGKLAFVKVGSRRLILRDDLVAFLVERRVVVA